MRTIDVVAAVLLAVGGLNWGLVGIAHFDLRTILVAIVGAIVLLFAYQMLTSASGRRGA